MRRPLRAELAAFRSHTDEELAHLVRWASCRIQIQTAKHGKASPVQWVIAGALVLCAVALAAAGCMPDVHSTYTPGVIPVNQSSASQNPRLCWHLYVQRQSGHLYVRFRSRYGPTSAHWDPHLRITHPFSRYIRTRRRCTL